MFDFAAPAPMIEAYDRLEQEKRLRNAQARAHRAQAQAEASAQQLQQPFQQKDIESTSTADSVSSAQDKVPPRSLTQAILQRPPLSRPGSASVLGNIFQGFVREGNALASQNASGASTPTGEKKAWSWSKETDPNIIRGWN